MLAGGGDPDGQGAEAPGQAAAAVPGLVISGLLWPIGLESADFKSATPEDLKSPPDGIGYKLSARSQLLAGGGNNYRSGSCFGLSGEKLVPDSRSGVPVRLRAARPSMR